MPEFMQERNDLAELHQLVPSGEIADQPGDRYLLALNAVDEREHRSMLEFAFARVHIEIETADDVVTID